MVSFRDQLPTPEGATHAERVRCPLAGRRDPVVQPAEPRAGVSEDGRRPVPGLPDAAFRVEAEQEERAEHEEDDQRDDRGPVGPADLEDDAEQERPEPRRTPLTGVVEGEVLTLATAGDQQAEERPGER